MMWSQVRMHLMQADLMQAGFDLLGAVVQLESQMFATGQGQ